MKTDEHADRSSNPLLDPAIWGDDGPITPDQCALWLDSKYSRHGELEDRAAAMWLRKLAAMVSRGTHETNPKPTDGDRLSAWQREHGEPLPDELDALQKDADRYRFLRQGEDTLDTEDEAAFSEMWESIGLKGNWGERMDRIVDAAMDRVGPAVNGRESR